MLDNNPLKRARIRTQANNAHKTMTTILKQFGTNYAEISLSEHPEGLKYWVTITLYSDQTDTPYVLCMTDNIEQAERAYEELTERLASY